MKSEGSAGSAVMGSTHLPLPMYGTTRKSTPPTRRPTGLNWDATRPAAETTAIAIERTKTRACKGCGNATPVDELRDRYCPVCTASLEERFHDDVTHQREEDPCPTTSTTSTATSGRKITAGPTVPPATSVPSTTKTVSSSASTADSRTPDLRMAIAHLRAARDGLTAELHRLDVTLALLVAEQPAAPAPTPERPPAPTPTPAGFQVIPRRPRTRRRPGIDAADVVRRYQAGDTAPTIGTALGISPKRVREVLDDAGIQRRDDRTTHSGSHKKTAADDNPDLVATVRRLYLEEELSLGEVGERVGLSQKGVQGIAERHGIPLRPAAAYGARNNATKISPEQAQAIVERYQAGESTGTLAKAYGVSTPTIVHHLDRAGVARRTKAEAAAVQHLRAARG